MIKNKIQLYTILIILLAMATINVGCAKKEVVAVANTSDINETTVDKNTDDTQVKVGEKVPVVADPVVEPTPIIADLSPFTGLPIPEELVNQRPIGIMISNIKAALPQNGVSNADILYETLVEGGITRLFGIFHDFNDEKIGPIRSSRHYYLDFALDNDAIYTHVGQSTYATKAFKELSVDRFYGISKLDAMLTFRDPNRKAPHSTYTSFTKLTDTWTFLDYRKELKPDSRKFQFNTVDTPLIQGESLTSIALNYSPYITATFKYNSETGLYERFQFGEKHIDATNDQQLAFKNIIVQFADIWTIKGDKLGCMDMTLITTGKGLLITDGKKVAITWVKSSHESPTKYYLEDGTEITLNPGKTFISVFPLNRIDKIIMEGNND